VPVNQFDKNVFINCPFDFKYKNIIKAILFTLVYCDLEPRIAAGSLDSLELRLPKIKKLIEESKYSIHDISRMRASKKGEYARFNMPFELGLNYGFRVYGGKNASGNKSLIFSTKRYNYARAVSDLAGIDIKAHHDDPEEVVRGLRNWIRNTLNKTDVLSADNIWLEYLVFSGEFKKLMKEENFSRKEQNRMEPKEYIHYINKWKKERSI
jgi:hypothetical protein